MKKPYNIKLLKPMGDILIQYTEKSNSKEIFTTRQEELDRIMFNEEKINIFEVLNERDLYKNIINELRSWLEEEIKEEYRLYKEFLRIGVIKGETKLTSQFKRVLSKLNELEGKNE